ncbi:hypothetical protein [Pseudothermotoga sp.]
MARRLMRSLLLALLLVAFSTLIFRIYDWGVGLEHLQEQFLDACLTSVELQSEKLVEESLKDASSPELVRYAELAKRLGGYLGFDPESKKVVVALRRNSDVKVAVLDLKLDFEGFVYYVCDPSGVVLSSSNKSMVGKTVDTVLSNLSSSSFSFLKYQGKRYVFKQKINERFGFKIFVGITHISSRLQSYLVVAAAIVLFLTGLVPTRKSDGSEEKIAKAISDIIEKHKFDEDMVKNPELRNQLLRLANKLQRSDRMLRETAEKLENLKQLLEKKKTGL